MHPLAAGELPLATAMGLELFHDEYDSNCSTPYVSAPSSPGRRSYVSAPSSPGRGTPAAWFFSAPASPMHYVLSSSASSSEYVSSSAELSADFEFSARLGSSSSSATVGSMISADELFLNGQIRPMRLSSHLQRPQKLAPLLDLEVEVEEEEEEEEDFADGGGEGSCEKSGKTSTRGREGLRSWSKSLRRRARSMSPLRNWQNGSGGRNRCLVGSEKKAAAEEELPSEATTPSVSASSSRSNSTSSRSSKRWVFLMDFLHRSKSEGSGRSGKDKILSTISFSSIHKEKEKKPLSITTPSCPKTTPPPPPKKPGKPAGKRPVPPSPHELFYTASRAQAEEMRKKTYLPYRQGLLGCLGFSSKSYGAMNGLARALNPVSSR